MTQTNRWRWVGGSRRDYDDRITALLGRLSETEEAWHKRYGEQTWLPEHRFWLALFMDSYIRYEKAVRLGPREARDYERAWIEGSMGWLACHLLNLNYERTKGRFLNCQIEPRKLREKRREKDEG